jgi:uncharacterized protein
MAALEESAVPIAEYPELSRPDMEMRPILHPRFQSLPDGISEFTFAGIYLFREAHDYVIGDLGGGLIVISGGGADPFFMLPFGLPAPQRLNELFDRFKAMKCVPESLVESLRRLGYRTWEDRDNFDYLYRREALADLPGRGLHTKKNLVKSFLRNNNCVARPLLEEYVGDALKILDRWRSQQDSPGDFVAAKEALERMEELQLCGGIFYIDDEPAAYTLGEELARGTTFVVHFEKAVLSDQHKGLYQYVNQAFAAVLPEKYAILNREQDLGEPGLRQAKESYKPIGFIKKYRASR